MIPGRNLVSEVLQIRFVSSGETIYIYLFDCSNFNGVVNHVVDRFFRSVFYCPPVKAIRLAIQSVGYYNNLSNLT